MTTLPPTFNFATFHQGFKRHPSFKGILLYAFQIVIKLCGIIYFTLTSNEALFTTCAATLALKHRSDCMHL